MKDFVWEIVSDEARFKQIISEWKQDYVAADVETYGTRPSEGKLLGLSLSGYSKISGKSSSCYIPFNHFENGAFIRSISDGLERAVREMLGRSNLLGHNFTYDKRWLDSAGCGTKWVADTRIAWHLASAPKGPRPYDLKSLQVEVLGWESKGDIELDAHVKARGGSLNNGDHYLADLDVLAKYACLDTLATLEGWTALKPFFDQHDYHWMLQMMMEYNLILEENTSLGIKVDEIGLAKAKKRLESSRDAAKKRLDKQLGAVIEELEKDWLHMRLKDYVRASARELYSVQPHRWERFNWNSDAHKRELFYDKLGNEVVYTTEGGKPSTNEDSVKLMDGDWVDSYLKYEKANTLLSNFAGPYGNSVRNGRIHPGFNICGTVSYRLSGFKPYFLNAPFSEKRLMKNFTCDQGWIGLHADLSAIEPTVTAHFSEDPALLKVFRDGLGDIYLDLARGMFPNDQDLRLGYNPYEPITEAIKKRFSRQRKIAKIIHLAVSYTGTKSTVHRNLLKEGIELSIWDADRLVQSYWRTFKKVKELEGRLRELNRKEGLLRNVAGRIIRLPDPEYKDLFNRFIQSSGHDVLVLWVLEIAQISKEWGIELRPVIADIHDSTSWQVEEENKEAGKAIFQKALDNVNQKLQLAVPIRMEFKYFRTLAGLKEDE